MKLNSTFCVCCAALAALGLFASTAHALTYRWNNNSGGFFTDEGNWDLGALFGVPDADDTTVFRRGNVPAYSVDFWELPPPLFLITPIHTAVARLIIGTNTVTFDEVNIMGGSSLSVIDANITETGRGLIIGQTATDVAVLNSSLSSLSTFYATLGSAAGSSGTLNVNAGAFYVFGTGATHDLIVGYGGSGAINVSNGADVVVADYAVVARLPGSTGSVSVSDAGSTWASNVFYVGYGAQGSLDVSSSGEVNTTTGYVGVSGGSVGTAHVSGDGSTWSNTGELYVGHAGDGTLDVTSGGVVRNSVGYIGNLAGSTGEVTVDGMGSDNPSTWNSTGNLYVGDAGNGALNITGGGRVTNQIGVIGNLAGSMGVAVVDGSNSTWTNTLVLTVGFASDGTLNIINQGVVSSFTTFIGRASGSSGVVTVEDMGTMSVTNGTLYVGNSGQGTLDVKTKGQVTSSGGIIGAESESTGSTVTLDDGTWTIHGSLTVGGAGNGTLTVMGGGHIVNDTLLFNSVIGNQDDSQGAVTVDGMGSTWTNTNQDLYVGKGGKGTLTIKGGGHVENKFAAVGFDATSICDVAPCSTVTVDGAGSSWTNDGLLSIGDQGTGELHVSNGGTVSSLFGRVANNNSGIVTVDGMGSTWDVDEKLEIAVSGIGSMTIMGGAQVNSFDGVLGANSGSMGTVTVGGTDANMNPSRWDNTNDLSVDIGSLTIKNGGQVSSDVGNIASVAGETGTVTVGGAGSTWTNNSDLSVGLNSVGILAVTSGGQVTNVNGFLGFNADSSGTATVDGTGSRWTNSGNLNIGHVGNGKLTVTNGGTVEAVNVAVGVMGLGELHGDGNIVGNVNSKGLVSPGTSPGALSIDGDYSQGGANAKLLIELASAFSFDQLLVTGTASLAGTLEVALLDGFATSGQHSLTILSAGAVTGEFGTELLPSLPDVTFDVIYNATSVVLQITAPVLPGDYNQDGSVDAADYVMWRKTDGAPEVYNTWRTHFGEPAAGGSGANANATVPEPATLVLLIVAVAGVSTRWRWCT